MPSFSKIAPVLALSALPAAQAWGTLGHTTVAYIAQNFASSETASWAEKILSDTSTSYLANVATWADSYRYTTAGAFSAGYHYIDANDDPPSSCNVDYDRDCTSDGCIVSAIANYTERVQSSSLSSTEVQNALKFLVHFGGDIHQPLHVEGTNVGGNTIDVTFDGTATNLHHIWDTNMPEKLVGGYTSTYAQSWANNLTTEIKTGSYKSKASGWLDGIDASDAQSTAMTWASDSNAFVCTTVLPDGISAVSGKELDGAYYETAVPVIELQIAKAGYRLAAWLNLIATGETGLNGTTRRSLGFKEKRGLNVGGGVSLPIGGPTKAQRRRWAWEEAHPDHVC